MNKRTKKSITYVRGHGTAVNVVDGDIAFALSQFKRLVKKHDVITEQYDRMYYVKPSTKRKKILDIAKYEQKKLQKLQEK